MEAKTKLSTIAAFVLIVVFTVSVAGYSKNGNNLYEIGKEASRVYKQEHGSNSVRKIVLEVNGVKISSGEVSLRTVALEQSLGRKPSREEIIEAVTKQAMMVKEAEKRKISVSKPELDDYIDVMRKSFEGLEGFEKSQYIDLLRGLGYTENNFWDSEYAREGSRRALLAVKLREDILKEAPSEIKGDYEKEWKHFEEMIDDLAEEADVEILDESAFDD